jgi:acetyltransferase-like isoleucine patch superfamily enzyme
MTHILFYIESLFKNNLYKLKGFILKLYLLSHGCKVGKKLRCHQFPKFRIPPYHNIDIGSFVTIGDLITIEVFKNAQLKIGDYVKVTQNVLISSGNQILIGNNSLIGENVSIRDGDHNFHSGDLISTQGYNYDKITIEDDVWIGAGCIILKGSHLPRGVVAGANSLINRKASLEPYSIYGGNPLRKIGIRKSEK